MWGYLSDKVRTLRLKAQYERVVHERLLELTSEAGPQPVSEDPGRWLLLGGEGGGLDEPRRQDARRDARQLVLNNPHAHNIIQLLESYVTGPGLELVHRARRSAQADDDLLATVDGLWRAFLAYNEMHYSHGEHARRTWRDGECFVRKFGAAAWPPPVRFIDPEAIGPTPDHPDSQGILTDPDDVETRRSYLRIDPSAGKLLETIEAADVVHTRRGADSNQKRGVTVLLPVLKILGCFDQWVETELLARKLQSSIVLWRKVQGSPQQASAVADAASTGSVSEIGGGSVRAERIRPGTILTTNQATQIEFLQPKTNFSDAVPLGRMLLLCIAAGAGLPEFMLTSDASNANFASTMVAEGPAVKLFQSEQQFFGREFSRMWRWVMDDAIAMRLLPGDLFDRVEPCWTFPQLVNRDRPRERMADVRLVEAGVLSRAEVARRDGADPEAMRGEIAGEGHLS